MSNAATASTLPAPQQRCEVGGHSDDPCSNSAAHYIEPSRAPGGYGRPGFWACENCIRRHYLEDCINPDEEPS